MLQLEEQVIVITGASSGIGLITARRAAAAGAKVFLIARSVDALAQITQDLKTAGYNAAYACADVGNRSQLQAAAARVLEVF